MNMRVAWQPPEREALALRYAANCPNATLAFERAS